MRSLVTIEVEHTDGIGVLDVIAVVPAPDHAKIINVSVSVKDES